MDIDAFLAQINHLLLQRGLSMKALIEHAGSSAADYRQRLTDGRDLAGSTLHQLAGALNAEWLLVPAEHVLNVRRMLDAEGVSPDYSAPGASELFLKSLQGTRSGSDE